MYKSINEILPLYSIFILLLVITADFSSIFPCRLQRNLSNNIFLKHFFGFATMLFFVVLSTPLKNQDVLIIIRKSLMLYILFIMIIKTDYRFFIAIIILLAVLYLRMLKKYELIAMLDDEDIKDPTIDTMIYINNIIFISVIVLTIIGFFIYMGEKKYEYKNKFSYINFLFGIYKCT